MECVRRGITIKTDFWRCYVDLKELSFIHLTVKHFGNIVYPRTCGKKLVKDGYGLL